MPDLRVIKGHVGVGATQGGAGHGGGLDGIAVERFGELNVGDIEAVIDSKPSAGSSFNALR